MVSACVKAEEVSGSDNGPIQGVITHLQAGFDLVPALVSKEGPIACPGGPEYDWVALLRCLRCGS